MKSIWKLGLAATLALSASSALAEDRSVALILDASGSMNGHLTDGTVKINAAKNAVRNLVGQIPDSVRLSFRAYGHQHHRSKHNCTDTQMLVPFGRAPDVRAGVVNTSDGLKAQGYTPITHVLGLAADDLKPENGKRAIVLVSDGKETCEGDPCLLAKKLAEADTDLTIHTVGFGVDPQARLQLQCIADAARGTYYDANSAVDLAKTMEEAVEATAEPEIQDEVITITLPEAQEGTLEIIAPYFNEVVDAETGEQVAVLTDSTPSKVLPAGIYNIKFGKTQWLKSVAVRADETTTIEPGRLRVEGPYFNDVLDPETGEIIEKATKHHADFPLLAGLYDVAFGKALWKNVVVNEGETTVLNPGRLKIKNPYFHDVLDPATGQALLKLTKSNDELPLPPGTYDVRFGKKLWRGIKLTEGETVTLDPALVRMAEPYFNRILDQDTGEEVEKFTRDRTTIPLAPGTYTVMFGKAAWKDFTVEAGDDLRINPGRIKIEGKKFYIKVFDEAGTEVIKLTEGTNDIPFPPGKYRLDVGGQEVPVTLIEGKRLVLKLQ
ncbi:VWA domain-containing protein [Labrenzia sp. PHM005]|uniref:vWA domain-containing protein n=1 Tax=Labrenzia sp. PHM005 TaxID=2590016 RepID=UPI00114046F6|nr:VWA domain-containing protein [Labrenzia sp. PHM005]QDG78948.1 VWA domain-containing protein [Labrenzia sp. PHM005]